jgi:hypothetical protein
MAQNRGLPILSGTYIWTWFESCAMLTGPGVGGVGHETGLLTFNPRTGVVSRDAWGTSGWQLARKSGTTNYSNTATTITIGGDTYQLFYGALPNSIITYFSGSSWKRVGDFCGLMLEKAVHCLGILHYG